MDVECHVRVAQSPIAGNGLFAERFIAAGQTVAILPRPLVGVLDVKRIDSTCSNCFLTKKNDDDQPLELSYCLGCRRVKYCSKACQRESWKYSHKFECKILKRFPSTIPSLVRAAIRCLILLKHDTISDEQKRDIARMSTFISERNITSHEVEATIKSTYAMLRDEPAGENSPGLVTETVIMLMVNAFTLIEDILEPLGIAFDPLISTANHSCVPNAMVIFDGAQVSLRSLKPIQKDEEVFQAYLDTTDLVQSRQARLKEVYGFDCRCPRCLTQLQVSSRSHESVVYKQAVQAQEHGTSTASIERLQRLISIAQSEGKPEVEQPLPMLYQELFARLNDFGRFDQALIIAVKQYFVIDPVLYDVSFHVVRVVHTWALVKLIMYIDSTYKLEGRSIAQMEIDWGVIDFLIPLRLVLHHLKEDVFRSHGNCTLTRKIWSVASDLEKELATAGPQMVEFYTEDPTKQWRAFKQIANRQVENK